MCCKNAAQKAEKCFVLAKKYRIQSARSFKKIYKSGKKIYGNFFILRLISNNFKNSRFAVVVSKKVALKAVVRNKIKRQVLFIIQNNLKNFNANYDIVLIVKKEIIKAEFSAIKKDVGKIIDKIKS